MKKAIRKNENRGIQISPQKSIVRRDFFRKTANRQDRSSVPQDVGRFGILTNLLAICSATEKLDESIHIAIWGHCHHIAILRQTNDLSHQGSAFTMTILNHYCFVSQREFNGRRSETEILTHQ
jgi:L-alanine-DL-glutamate epimerase-like enolase superfamily enzyme